VAAKCPAHIIHIDVVAKIIFYKTTKPHLPIIRSSFDCCLSHLVPWRVKWP